MAVVTSDLSLDMNMVSALAHGYEGSDSSHISAEPLEYTWEMFKGDNVLSPLGSQFYEKNAIGNELRELALLEDDWDGNGGVSVSSEVISKTESLLNRIPTTIPFPDLVPNPNGTISLEWESDDRFFYLEIGDRDYSFIRGKSGEVTKGYQGQGIPSASLVFVFASAAVCDSPNNMTSVIGTNLRRNV